MTAMNETKKKESGSAEDVELVHFKWKRFKQIVVAQMNMVDKQLEEAPNELESLIGSVMDGLDYILYHRGRLHHALSRKARRHGIDPAKFGWGFHKRVGLSDEKEEVGEVLEGKKNQG